MSIVLITEREVVSFVRLGSHWHNVHSGRAVYFCMSDFRSVRYHPEVDFVCVIDLVEFVT